MKGRISRDRSTPGRATGRLSFTIRWPGDSLTYYSKWSAPGARSPLQKVRKHFEESLRHAPLDQADDIQGRIYAEIRAKNGGVRRLLLAEWRSGMTLEVVFAKAASAYRQLDREEWDYKWKEITFESPPGQEEE